MMDNTPPVSIVIVNWNRLNDTLACVESVKRSHYPASSIIVVDNGSRDGSVERISQVHPDVTVIANDVNLGFAGGNNKGIACALERHVQYVLLLNNDATIEPETIGALIRCASTFPKTGAVGAKIFTMDRPDTLDFCYGTVKYHHWLVTMEGAGLQDQPRFSQEREVEWISGCCMLMNRATLSDIGAFDDDFFAYLEDVDWCLRARQKGYRVMFCPNARVRHRGSASTGWNSPQINYFYGRNSILFLRKHGKMIQWLKFLSAFLIAFMLRLLKCTLRGGVRNVLFSLTGMYDGLLKRRPRFEILRLR